MYVRHACQIFPPCTQALFQVQTPGTSRSSFEHDRASAPVVVVVVVVRFKGVQDDQYIDLWWISIFWWLFIVHPCSPNGWFFLGAWFMVWNSGDAWQLWSPNFSFGGTVGLSSLQLTTTHGFKKPLKAFYCFTSTHESTTFLITKRCFLVLNIFKQ